MVLLKRVFFFGFDEEGVCFFLVLEVCFLEEFFFGREFLFFEEFFFLKSDFFFEECSFEECSLLF